MWSIFTQVTMTTMSERLQIKRVRQECGKFRSKLLLCYEKLYVKLQNDYTAVRDCLFL